MTMTARETTNALFEFQAEHGSVLDNALMVYAERMREVAAECLGGANAPEPAPAASPAGTITLRPTPGGFAAMARAFTEAADRADAARKAWAKLAGDEDDEDSSPGPFISADIDTPTG